MKGKGKKSDNVNLLSRSKSRKAYTKFNGNESIEVSPNIPSGDHSSEHSFVASKEYD